MNDSCSICCMITSWDFWPIQSIDWRWFIASQFAFGIVAGLVVARHTPVRTLQYMPFAVRAGFEAGGLEHEHRGKGPTP